MLENQDPRMPPGWSRQQLQLPRDLNKLLTVAASQSGHGAIKLIGSAAIAAFLGLPVEVRDRLMDWVIVSERRDPQRITPEDAWAVLWDALEKHRAALAAQPLPTEATHRPDRIVTPELLEKTSKDAKRTKRAGEAA